MVVRKEEVVVSGIGGLFAECNNLDELKDFLFNKNNGITIDSRRWNPNELSGIAGTGKLKNVDKFDAMFFSAHPKLAEVMDPMTRMCLERSIEAIIDAGLSPADLSGTNTAVFTGSAISETEMFTLDCSKYAAFSMLGRSRTMQANRVSYILNLSGPSFAMDAGWMCGSNGLEKAKEMIENGHINAAIVGVTNLVLRPEIQLQFQGLNRLTQSDRTKPFSSNADGYNRSEACIVIFLQKASDAKRSYGTILSVKSMQFGEHEEHVSHHTSDHLKSLLLKSYEEANVDPATVDFVEAYGSGIKSEDTMELNVMEEVFCTKNRKTPLKIGSVKGNVGHAESGGLFMSIAKAIITLECGYIPPNINYTEPNENVAALKTGKIRVVTEKSPLVGDVVGVTSFGLLNAFSHVVLRRNNKVKHDKKNIDDVDCIPRLILVSGRDEKNTREAVNRIKRFGNDAEYLALINEVFTKNINAHFFRTFSIFPSLDEARTENVWNVTLKKRPVWFIFSGMGSQWQGMGTHLLKLPIFAESIDKIDGLLKPRGVDIKYILTSQDAKLFDNILNSFVGIAAIQIGLVDVLKAMDIVPDGLVGHSVGELGCAYADGCFTAEEMILSAYARGRASIETDLIKGMMAAIGLGYEQIKNRLPHDVDVACRNSDSSCTISGPVDSINAFVEVLVAEKIFAKAVNVANIAYHSRYIKSAAPTLLKYLKEVIKEPKKRSSKWISSSLPESEWKSDIAQYSSPEYHTNNLLSSVLFEDALKHVPNDAIAIEIAPHGLLQAILKGALPDTVSNIPLTKRMYGDSVRFLLTSIGNMYANGLNPKVQALYPSIAFPVSRGTPSVGSLPFWDHSRELTPVVALNSKLHARSGEKLTSLSLNNNIQLTEYQLYGHHILPFSFILCNVWKIYAEIHGQKMFNDPIRFQNLKFKNNVEIRPNDSSCGYTMIQKGTGCFEYNFNNETIFSGVVNFSDEIDSTKKPENSEILYKTSENVQSCISKDEIYTVLEKNGYCLGDNYRNITNLKSYKNYIRGHVKWNNDWIYFLDSLFKFPALENLGMRPIEAPVSIREVKIIPAMFENLIDKDVLVDYNLMTKKIHCSGVMISDVKLSPVVLPELESAAIKLEKLTFVRFDQPKSETIGDFIYDSMDIITEVDKLNSTTTAGKIILCTPYHYGDSITKECTKAIKQFLERRLFANSAALNWENVSDVSKDDDSGRYVTVTNWNYLQDTIRALANKTCSYAIVSSKRKIQNFKDWKIITQQRFNVNYLALMKKTTPLNENSSFIKTTSKDYDSSIWTAIENSKCLKSAICIISKTEPSEGISKHVEESLKKYQSQKLRFVFILDSNAPAFETHKSFYADQLSKGLIVNIYKNGGWGSYKRIIIQDLKENTKVADYFKLKNISVNSEHKLTIKYLGINFKDLVIENTTENDFGPLEYSALVDDSRKIMGITSFTQDASTQIKYDALLSWPVPSIWSLEDAATVPLTYAMNYYVFKVLCCLSNEKSILVTSGLHPIGQAAIAICLAEKCDTYAIVDSGEQASRLSDMFPLLPPSRIIINTNNQFDIKLKMTTKSKGIDFVINLSAGEAFDAALRALAKHGKFFHFTKSDMKNQKNIGMKLFLKNTSFSVVSSNMLLNESDSNKKIVRDALMDGLTKGLIKPFDRKISATKLNSSDKIFEFMKSASRTEKTLLCLNDDGEKSLENVDHGTYLCNPDQIYVIVDSKSDWLDLAEWLVSRGAQKIKIVIKRCLMSSTTCRRFDRLISQNISIQIESDSHFKTRNESIRWLNSVISSQVLGSLFIINQFDCDKINNLRFAFEEYPNKSKSTSFVCVSSKGENICDELKSIGFNALNVSWDDKSTQMKNVSKLLVSLDTVLQKSNEIDTSSFICSKRDATKSDCSRQIADHIKNYLPETVEEMNLLKDKTVEETEFIEVQTKSPRYCQQKGILPIFVVPGFKPKLIDTFYKNLPYPAFEAHFSKNISSVDELSEILVNKIKTISNKSSVSLVGESWGGIVALKMGQILEARGIMVTISLLEGDPEILTNWAKSFLSDDNINNTLHSMYNSLFDGASQVPRRNCDGKIQSLSVSSHDIPLEENMLGCLKTIRSRLQALLETKPLSNKLLTKVLIFRYDRSFELNRNILDCYCINKPFVHIIAETDYKKMLVNKDMIRVISDNAALFNADGVDLSLSDKYENFNYYFEKFLK